jgi:hypothetical protein
MDWVKDVLANLVADLLALMAVYAAGLRLLDRFTERASITKVYVVVEADMENVDPYHPQEPPRRIRITNLSDRPFYDCRAVVRTHEVISTQFASNDVALMYEEPLEPGSTKYSRYFEIGPGKEFDFVDIEFESVRRVRYQCEASSWRPARIRQVRVSPLVWVRRRLQRNRR